MRNRGPEKGSAPWCCSRVIFFFGGMFLYKLLEGDCLELLKAIPEATVDLVLTDPPYNVGVTPSR